MSRFYSSFVLGYHGCDKSIAEGLLNGDEFLPSTNEYDWLGQGIYFWEANPLRGLEYATILQKRRAKSANPILEPCVIGAVIDLGHCLDLSSSNGIRAIEASHKNFIELCEKAGVTPPENSGGDDLYFRNLDCKVVMHLHEILEKAQLASYDTVKALFREGGPIYQNSGFYKNTHVQICVRNSEQIKGIFRVPKDHLTPA